MGTIKEKLKRLPFVARIYRHCHPGYGHCFICGLPWTNCKPHVVEIVECTKEHAGSGFFSTCEHCWHHSSFAKIKQSIYKLYEWWLTMGEEPYFLEDMIEQAKKDYLGEEIVANLMKDKFNENNNS